MRRKEINKSDFINDLHFFVKTLINTHPIFIINKGLKNKVLDTLPIIETKINLGCDVDLFVCFLNQILAITEDAHSIVNFDESCLKFPIGLRCVNDTFYVSEISTKYDDITGKTVESINGISIYEIFEKCKGLYPYENEVSRHLNFCYYINIVAFWNYLGFDVSSGINVKLTDGTSVFVSNERMVQTENYKIKIGKHPITCKYDNNFKFDIINNSICYFQFNLMVDDMTLKMFDEIGQSYTFLRSCEDIGDFNAFLDNMFEKIKYNNINTLVIDLRNNPGGNNILGYNLMEKMKMKKNKVFSSKIRISPLLKQKWAGIVSSNDNRYDILVDESDFSPFNAIVDKYLIKEEKSRFDGKVIVIQGNATASSAMHFITMLKDNCNEVITIGTPTYQNPNCFGNIIPFSLPNTKINGFISCSTFNRPDMNNKDKSLMPDILIETNISEKISGKDNCWDWIMENHC